MKFVWPKDFMNLKLITSLSFLLFSILCPFSYAQNQSCKSLYSSSLLEEQKRLQIFFETRFEENCARDWNKYLAEEINEIITDPIGGLEKIEILRALGFQINGKVVKAPRYIDFINNYLNLLSKLEVPQNESILPAIVLWKVDGGRIEYRLITPGVDPWPNEPGFQMSQSPIFNLPYDVILEAHKNGKFPLMNNAVHDIFHFVAFLRNPEFMRTLRLSVKEINNPRPVKYMGFRLNYIDEWISLGNPKLKKRIQQVFSTFKKFPENKSNSFNFFLNSINAMPEKQLIQYANHLNLVYPELLLEYGGAVTRSSEKLSNSKLTSGNQVFNFFLNQEPIRELSLLWRESPSLFSKTLKEILEIVELPDREFAKYLTHNIVGVNRPKYSQLYKSNQNLSAYGIPENEFLEPSENARAIVVQMLRTHIARMEYVAWRSVNDMTYKDIIMGLLRADGSVDSKVGEFIKDGWGENSFLYKVISFGLKVQKKD